MPRTAARPGPPTFTFGVWGQGETTEDNIKALLDDYIDSLGEATIKFVLPLDKDLTTDTIGLIAAYAVEVGGTLEVIQTAAPRVKVLKEIKENADRTHESSPEEIEADFVKILAAKPERARLLFLWSEDADGEPDEDDQRLLFAVMDADVEAMDLTQGLDALGGTEEPGEEPAAAPEEPAEGEEPEHSEEEVRAWPIRRLRTYCIDLPDGLSKTEAAEMSKDDLLDWLYPVEGAEGDSQPVEEPVEEESSRARATRLRKEQEASGEESPAVKRVRGAKAAEEPQEEPDEAQAGTYLGGASEKALSAAEALGNLIADVIIDRLAERITKEPETSALRREIAPPRPPGKPRTDGSAPTRRRTAK